MALCAYGQRGGLRPERFARESRVFRATAGYMGTCHLDGSKTFGWCRMLVCCFSTRKSLENMLQ